jgi:hypothetical protein
MRSAHLILLAMIVPAICTASKEDGYSVTCKAAAQGSDNSAKCIIAPRASSNSFGLGRVSNDFKNNGGVLIISAQLEYFYFLKETSGNAEVGTKVLDHLDVKPGEMVVFRTIYDVCVHHARLRLMVAQSSGREFYISESYPVYGLNGCIILENFYTSAMIHNL